MNKWVLALSVFQAVLFAMVLGVTITVWVYMVGYIGDYFAGELGLTQLLWKGFVPVMLIVISAVWVVRYRRFLYSLRCTRSQDHDDGVNQGTNI